MSPVRNRVPLLASISSILSLREIFVTKLNFLNVLLDQRVGQGLLAHFVSLEEHQLELTVDILNLFIDLL